MAPFFPPMFLQLYCPIWESSCDSHTTQPPVHAGCFSVSIIHQTLTWTTGSLACIQIVMHACNCTQARGVWTHVWVCTESWLWEKNALPHRGIKPTSAGWRSDALTHWATTPPNLWPRTTPLLTLCALEALLLVAESAAWAFLAPLPSNNSCWV